MVIMSLFCEECQQDVIPTGLGECPDCHADLEAARAINFPATEVEENIKQLKTYFRHSTFCESSSEGKCVCDYEKIMGLIDSIWKER